MSRFRHTLSAYFLHLFALLGFVFVAAIYAWLPATATPALADEVEMTFTPLPTVTVTQTRRPTSTPTPTATATSSPTPEEATFDCNLVTFVPVDENVAGEDQNIGFQSGRVTFDVRNANNVPAVLRDMDLHWSSNAYDADPQNEQPVPGYPGFFFDRFELEGDIFWDGKDDTPETSTLTEIGAITGRTFEIPAGETSRIAAIYRSSPTFLSDVLPRSAFSGTNIIFVDPLTNVECNPIVFTSTNDFVPPPPLVRDCYLENIEFGTVPDPFEDFGWVRYYLTNHNDFPATIVDFSVTWEAWELRDEPGTVRLQKVVATGSNPEVGTLLWSAATDEGVGIEREPGVYAPITRADGLWQGDYTVAPNTTINFWLDFSGGDLSDDRNMVIADLDGTMAVTGCVGLIVRSDIDGDNR
ncbi:MAG: hypothetical protein AAFV33_13200, partial [Chloroflexota bacterium]